jgi:hypothetical protein
MSSPCVGLYRLARRGAGRELQVAAWRWALANRSGADGSLPSGRDIGRQFGRHERWGRLVKRAGLTDELGVDEGSESRMVVLPS